jgi:carboxylesterase
MMVLKTTTSLLPGAEPFHFEAPGDLACLLIHGFTGSPQEVRSLGQHLADQGITAHGILLTAHGTAPDQLALATKEHWVDDVDAALSKLEASGKRVFLCGFSMGGALALNIAARRQRDPRVLGVITMSAPLVLVDWRQSLTPVARLLRRWQRWGRPDIKDQRQWVHHVGYRSFHPLAAVQLLRLLRETRRLALDVRQPLLVIHAHQDNTVPAFNAELIVASVSSPDRRVVWLDNCFHVVTVDFDAELVREEVFKFIRAHSDPLELPPAWDSSTPVLSRLQSPPASSLG